MAFIVMEVYCTECSFSYVDVDEIPDNEDVIQIKCDCGKFHILHRCKDGKYSKMSVRDVSYSEYEERKKARIPHCPNCMNFSLVEECIPNQNGECDYQPIKDKCDCDACREKEKVK